MVCVEVRLSRQKAPAEPAVTGGRWFLSGCYRKAEDVTGLLVVDLDQLAGEPDSRGCPVLASGRPPARGSR